MSTKKKIIGISSALLVATTISSCSFQMRENPKEENTITVIGSGESEFKPVNFIAHVTINVDGDDTVKSQGEANKIKDKIITKLKDEKLYSDKTSWTGGLNSGVQNDLRSSYNLEVPFNIKDVKKVTQIINENGDNKVSISLSPDDSKPDTEYDIARQRAISDARSKATRLAEISGKNIGPIIRIEEENNGSVLPLRTANTLNKENTDSSIDVNPQSVKVQENYTVTFSMK